ncbi:hypothetical protein Tco_1027950 [Tanacetum coccineum]
MGRDTIQLENAISAISQEYLLEFTSEYGIPEGLHPKLLGPDRGFSGGQSRRLSAKMLACKYSGTFKSESRGMSEVVTYERRYSAECDYVLEYMLSVHRKDERL